MAPEFHSIGQLVVGIVRAAVALESLSCGSAPHLLAIHESALRITNTWLTLQDVPAEQLWWLRGNPSGTQMRLRTAAVPSRPRARRVSEARPRSAPGRYDTARLRYTTITS